jgi:hypothetical protein
VRSGASECALWIALLDAHVEGVTHDTHGRMVYCDDELNGLIERLLPNVAR